jgi:hypothetical protein
MTTVTSADDRRLLDLIRQADPLAGDRSLGKNDAIDADGERLLARILSTERRHAPRPDSEPARRLHEPARRSHEPTYRSHGHTRRPRHHRRRVALSVATSGAVLTTAAVLMSTAGNNPSAAFAGWSARPTAPAGGAQVQAAESQCQRDPKLASLSPTLVETRGPYTLLIYAASHGGVCLTGPSIGSPTGEPVVAPLRTAILATPVAAGTIERVDNASVIAKASPPAAELGFNDGRVGPDVTAVTLVLDDQTRVRATVANGWFAAWWPGRRAARGAEIMTTTGTSTQRLAPPTGYETATSAARAG